MLRTPSCPRPSETEEGPGHPVSGLHGSGGPLASRSGGPGSHPHPLDACPLLPPCRGLPDPCVPGPGPWSQRSGVGTAPHTAAGAGCPGPAPPSWERSPQTQAPARGGQAGCRGFPGASLPMAPGREQDAGSATCHPPAAAGSSLRPHVPALGPDWPRGEGPAVGQDRPLPSSRTRGRDEGGKGPVLEPALATDSRPTCQHAAPRPAPPGAKEAGARRGWPTHGCCPPRPTRPASPGRQGCAFPGHVQLVREAGRPHDEGVCPPRTTLWRPQAPSLSPPGKRPTPQGASSLTHSTRETERTPRAEGVRCPPAGATAAAPSRERRGPPSLRLRRLTAPARLAPRCPRPPPVHLSPPSRSLTQRTRTEVLLVPQSHTSHSVRNEASNPAWPLPPPRGQVGGLWVLPTPPWAAEQCKAPAWGGGAGSVPARQRQLVPRRRTADPPPARASS